MRNTILSSNTGEVEAKVKSPGYDCTLKEVMKVVAGESRQGGKKIAG